MQARVPAAREDAVTAASSDRSTFTSASRSGRKRPALRPDRRGAAGSRPVSGSPNRQLYSRTRPVVGQHQARVQEAGVRVPSRRRARTVAATTSQIRRRRRRATGAASRRPSPVFGPASPSPTRLESCASARGTTIRRRRARTRTPRAPRAAPRRRRWRRPPRGPPSRHALIAPAASSASEASATPFPAASPSALTTARPPSSFTNASTRRDPRPVVARGRRRPRGGVPCRIMSSFANAFDPPAGRRRVPDRRPTPSRPELVGEPGDQRSLRADHDQVGVEVVGEPELGLDVVGGGGVARGDRRDPGVPGRGVQLFHPRAPRQAPAQRVLPAAAADDEDLHATGRLCSRAGPTDTTETGTSTSSSIRRT